MRLPSIQINATSAKLEIQKTPTTIQMRQPMADMTIRQPHAQIDYQQRDATIQIDQSEAFADAGLKPISRHIREWAEKGEQQAKQAIATIAQQGDQMMKIEQGGLVIPQIAKTNSEDPIREFNIGFMPSSASKVKIQYSPGAFHMKVDQQEPIIKIKPNQPVINVNPGKTNIYLKQKSSISFSVPGLNVDVQK
ncbi:DUF6470 family protein [Bacillus sp. FJAT-29937]|uniref:DUF6470 family protein n=1 Tax=Bacillus sp. FJAT-29937 TaxID=1720553 RepID=UPI00083490D5|nr:DUF6470 family protein [Bacillus sp. FJAT-29937]